MKAWTRWPRRTRRNRRKTAQPNRWQSLRPYAARLLAVLFLVAASDAVWSWALARYDAIEGFDLKTVRIEGAFEQVWRKDIEAVVAPYAHKGFFDVDVNKIRDQLEQMPWVRRAAVRRSWPDALEVTVFEQQAIARWGKRGLVNRQSEIFYPQSNRPLPDLPQLIGVANSEKLMVSRLRQVNELLQPLSLSVRQLRLDDRRAWHVTLDNGLHLMLGRYENIRRLQRFVGVYRRVLAPRLDSVAGVDLRYTNGFIVQWKKDGKESRRQLG